MHVRIRAVEENDRTDWEQLVDDYAKFYKVTPPVDAKKHAWDWIFDPNESFWCDLAIDNDSKPVGFVQYQLMHRSLAGAKVCYLSDLFVYPEQRGFGTGRALIDHVITFAQTNGIENIRWLTQDSNLTAKKLYDTYVAQSEFVMYSMPVDVKN